MLNSINTIIYNQVVKNFMSLEEMKTKFKLMRTKKDKMVELIKSSKLDAVKKLDDSALSMSAGGLIMFAISLIVLAAVVPDAISQFYATNTSAWQINGAEDTKATVLWWLLPFIAVAVVIVAVYKWAD